MALSQGGQSNLETTSSGSSFVCAESPVNDPFPATSPPNNDVPIDLSLRRGNILKKAPILCLLKWTQTMSLLLFILTKRKL